MANTSYKAYFDKKGTKKAVEDLTLKELRKISHDLFAVVNKRIRRLAQKDVISPAYDSLMKKRGGKTFTSGGKNLKQLQKEFAQAVAFYNMETSTVTGAKRYENNLKKYVGSDVSPSTVSYIFDLLHRVQERIPEAVFGSVVGSIPVLNVLNNVIGSDINSMGTMYDTEEQKDEKIINDAIDKLMELIEQEYQRGVKTLNEISKEFNKLF